MGGHLVPSGIFAECQDLPSAWHSAKPPLPSALFCRVRHSAKYCFAECLDKKHSAKSQALGKDQFSSGDKVRERVMDHENTVCFNIRLHIDIDIIVASACTTLFAYVLEDTYMDVCLSALSQYLHS